MAALRPDDAVVSTYREHGHALARGVPLDAVMAEMFGKATGCSRGRGGSMHLFDAATPLLRRQRHRRRRPPARGRPRARRPDAGPRPRSPPASSATARSPRASSTSALNLAALWRLPVLFCCENNLLRHGHRAGRGTSRRPTWRCGPRRTAWRPGRSTGWTCWPSRTPPAGPSRRSAAGGGPHFLELRTYRFRAHSMYDPDRYRDKAEIAAVAGARPDRPASRTRMRAEG